MYYNITNSYIYVTPPMPCNTCRALYYSITNSSAEHPCGLSMR